MKVRNKGKADYTGIALHIHAGETAEVSDEQGAYLLSADCPGEFEKLEEAKKGKKGAE